jgi:hypothetical protein
MLRCATPQCPVIRFLVRDVQSDEHEGGGLEVLRRDEHMRRREDRRFGRDFQLFAADKISQNRWPRST